MAPGERDPESEATRGSGAIHPASLAAVIAAGRAPRILDVRSRLEYLAGHVPGAIHIPFWLMSVRVAHVRASHEEPVVVYCGHGPRAWMARAVLQRHGFRRVALLAGHMRAWRQAGLPLSRG